MSESLKNFDNLDEVAEKMQNGVAHFIFINAKEETREAFGTTKSELIPVLARNTQEQLNEIIEESVRLSNEREVEIIKVAEFQKLVRSKIEESKKVRNSRKASNEVLSFYDIEKQAWRSCRVDSILTVFN